MSPSGVVGILIICEMSPSERERERERRLVGWIGCEKCHLVESGIVIMCHHLAVLAYLARVRGERESYSII